MTTAQTPDPTSLTTAGDEKYIWKPSATIRISQQFSRQERLLLNVLIYDSQQNGLPTSDMNTIPYKDVCQALGTSTRNTESMKKALDKLTGTTIQWNENGIDRTTKWTVCTFLQGAEISNGQVSYALNSLIVKKINRPKLFAKLALVVQRKLKKANSIVIWEWLTDELCRNAVNKATITVDLDDFLHMLGLQNSTYVNNYKYIRRDIIKPSVEEITQHSELKVSVSTKKKGRSVAALIFKVERDTLPQMNINFGTRETQQQNILSNDAEALIEELVERGVTKPVARTLVCSHTASIIRANIQYTEAQSTTRNKAGYLVRAIKQNYSKHNEAVDSPQPTPPVTEITEEEFKSYRSKRIREIFETMPATKKNTLKKDFYDRVEAGGVEGLQGGVGKTLNTSMAEGLFFRELADTYLTQTHEKNYRSFVEWSETKV